MGRHSTFTQAIADEICERIAKGEPLAVICRSDEKFPDPSTVWAWRQSHPDFRQAIAHAREVGYDVIADECLQIANTPVDGVIVKTDADGETVTREDMLGHRKLQIETRLKLLAKWDPKRYGDKLLTENDTKVEVVIRDLTKS